MGRNRVFFPQAALDQWLANSKVELSDGELVIKAERRRYKIVEAVRVVSEVGGGDDVYEIVGRVKTVNFLSELGAELLGSSMIIGDTAYDVIPGFAGAPVGTLPEHRAEASEQGAVRPSQPPLPKSEEELLARYLMSRLE
jgi:hypothetical protein